MRLKNVKGQDVQNFASKVYVDSAPLVGRDATGRAGITETLGLTLRGFNTQPVARFTQLRSRSCGNVERNENGAH